MTFIMTIHQLCGISFFGMVIASFAYITKSIRQNDPVLLRYAITTSLIGDCVIFFFVIIQPLTATFLVYQRHLPFNTPWIIVAYLAFALVSTLWFLTALIKYINYKNNKSFRFKKMFYLLNVAMILIFCVIIHDAVMHQTWLWPSGIPY
jgi:uncharacterized membrane protein